jgi:hypothetical protein
MKKTHFFLVSLIACCAILHNQTVLSLAPLLRTPATRTTTADLVRTWIKEQAHSLKKLEQKTNIQDALEKGLQRTMGQNPNETTSSNQYSGFHNLPSSNRKQHPTMSPVASQQGASRIPLSAITSNGQVSHSLQKKPAGLQLVSPNKSVGLATLAINTQESVWDTITNIEALNTIKNERGEDYYRRYIKSKLNNMMSLAQDLESNIAVLAYTMAQPENQPNNPALITRLAEMRRDLDKLHALQKRLIAGISDQELLKELSAKLIN